MISVDIISNAIVNIFIIDNITIIIIIIIIIFIIIIIITIVIYIDIFFTYQYSSPTSSYLHLSGVYTNDELTTAGVNLKINEKENKDYFSHNITLPPSLAQTIGLFPIIFLSSNSMFPTAEEYTWRVRIYLIRI